MHWFIEVGGSLITTVFVGLLRTTSLTWARECDYSGIVVVY